MTIQVTNNLGYYVAAAETAAAQLGWLLVERKITIRKLMLMSSKLRLVQEHLATFTECPEYRASEMARLLEEFWLLAYQD